MTTNKGGAAQVREERRLPQRGAKTSSRGRPTKEGPPRRPPTKKRTAPTSCLSNLPHKLDDQSYVLCSRRGITSSPQKSCWIARRIEAGASAS